MELVEWAVAESKRLLADCPRRWLHVQGVAELASQVGPVLPELERPVLIAAAFLHDIGYSPTLLVTGVHQIDDAEHLRNCHLERLACLVAHHSEARFELEARGLANELARFERKESAVSDALTYCDMLTGAGGNRLTVAGRMEEVERRYEKSSVVVDALRCAGPALQQAIRRTEERRRRQSHPM